MVVDSASPQRVLVGTGPACELRLSDRQISRRQCGIELEGDALRLSDLGSTNGTRIGSIEVLEGRLRGGEVVRIGGTTLSIARVEAGPSDSIAALPLTFGSVVGQSLEMRRLYPLCKRIAASDVPVIIEGETGTGKEAMAEAIHKESPRASSPFVVFDCTAVPSNLVEAELFGHEKGAFTGAVSSRKGLFEQADGGTLLIDEIGDLDPTLQPKLLRAVERREIRRLGGDQRIQVDVRILSATRRDLDREVQAGRFRDDLFHRLAVARIELPPLRRRSGDVRMLAEHFAASMRNGAAYEIPEEVIHRWEDSAWTGNVRELRNAVARYLALGELGNANDRASDSATGGAPSADFIERTVAQGLPFTQARQTVVDRFERRYLESMLALNDNKVAKAAAASGIGRRYFQMLMARST